jgi:hypothetical protein
VVDAVGQGGGLLLKVALCFHGPVVCIDPGVEEVGSRLQMGTFCLLSIRRQENWYPTPQTVQFVQFAEAQIESLREICDAASLGRELATSGVWEEAR